MPVWLRFHRGSLKLPLHSENLKLCPTVDLHYLANGALADKAALNTTIKTAIEHIRKTYEI